MKKPSGSCGKSIEAILLMDIIPLFVLRINPESWESNIPVILRGVPPNSATRLTSFYMYLSKMAC